METTGIDRKEVAQLLSTAAYHLAACWDALRELEGITETEVEIDNTVVQSIAGDVDIPAELPTVDDETVTWFLESLDDDGEEE